MKTPPQKPIPIEEASEVSESVASESEDIASLVTGDTESTDDFKIPSEMKTPITPGMEVTIDVTPGLEPSKKTERMYFFLFKVEFKNKRNNFKKLEIMNIE